MKKPFKTLSSATLAAVFAASAIVPVASAEAATNKQIDEVVFSKDKELISLTAVEYNDAFEAGLLANDTISHIKVGDKYFTAEQFNDAFEAQSNLEEAIKLLEEKATPAELKDVTQGTIKDGELVGNDETSSTEVTAVKAITTTTVEVTFDKDAEVTAEGLKDQVLKVTDAEGKVVEATYRDGSLTDGKAIFDLPLNEKLVDAASYTAELGESKVEFVAKVLAPYAKKFNATTTAVTSTVVPTTGLITTTKSIFFDAVDQFGEAIKVTSLTNVKVSVSYNGLPLVQGTEYTVTVTNDKLEVKIDESKRTLVKDAKVDVKVETFDKASNASDAKVIETSTASFTVTEGAKAVATTIDPVKATYKTTVGDTQKVGGNVTEVLPTNEITLTAEVKDQYGNPVTAGTPLVRWVVTEGKDLITGDLADGTEDTNGNTVDFVAAKPGKVTIEAYNVANGAKQTYTVEIAASKLTAVAVDTSNTVKQADGTTALVNATPYNKEEAIVAVLDVTPTSALLKAEDVKFEVKTSTKDVTKEDLTVKAEKVTVGTGATAKEYIVVKATAAKTAVFTVTPYVGESFEKATIKGSSDITVNSVANPTVDKIEVEEAKANEFQAGVELVKAVKFFNKHGEQIAVKGDALTTVGTTGLTIKEYSADSEGKKDADVTNAATNVAFLGFTASTKGNYTANLVAGPKSVSVALTAVEAGKIQSLTLAGGSSVSVITNDSYDAKDETDNVVVISNKAYTLIPVSAKDNYGVDVTLKSTDLDTTTKNANVEVKYFSDLKGTETTTDVKYIGVHAATGAATEAFTVKLAGGVAAVDGFVAPSKQITVTAARKADKVTVTPTSLNLGLGGTATVKVNVVDQYGKAFDLENASEVTVTAADFTITDKKQSVDAKSQAIAGQYEFKATANDTGSKTIEIAVAGVTTKSTVNVNVAPASEIVKSVVITGTDVKDGAAANKLASNGDTTQLKAVGKDATGAEVSVNPSEVVWTSSNEALATVDETGLVTTKAVTKDEEVTITADVFGVKQTITFTISKDASVLKAGTLTLTDADKIDADSKTEGVQIYLDADNKATDGEVDGAITLTFTGKDQYGDNFGALKVNATSYNAAVAKAVVDSNNKVIVTAVKAGETQVRVTVGAEELIYTVKVTEDAVALAQAVQAGHSASLSALGTSITKAEGLASTTVGTGVGEVDQADLDNLNDAITAAKEVQTAAANKTQAELDAAKSALDTAISTFQGKIVS